jgi:hypothetical protein
LWRLGAVEEKHKKKAEDGYGLCADVCLRGVLGLNTV